MRTSRASVGASRRATTAASARRDRFKCHCRVLNATRFALQNALCVWGPRCSYARRTLRHSDGLRFMRAVDDLAVVVTSRPLLDGYIYTAHEGRARGSGTARRTRGKPPTTAVAQPHGEVEIRPPQRTRNTSRLSLRVRKEQSGGNGSKTQVSPRPSPRSRDCLLDDPRENVETSVDVCAQVNAQGAAPAPRENA